MQVSEYHQHDAAGVSSWIDEDPDDHGPDLKQTWFLEYNLII